MARTLEFNYPKALEKATRLFWKLGYAGTSLRPLLKAMGIGEGSFYNKLKSMDSAYLEPSRTNRRAKAAPNPEPTPAITAIFGRRKAFILETILPC